MEAEIRRTRWWLLYGVCLLLTLLPSSRAYPQAGTDLEGVVRGFAGEPLGRITLIFHNLTLNQRRRLETNAQGAFAGRGLSPGQYRVAILQEGKILWVISGVEISPAGQPPPLEINLAELRRVAEAPPVLEVELERRLRQHEEELARRMRVRDHYRVGIEALQRGDYQAAIRELEAARDLQPSEALYQAQLGEAYAAAGRTADALAAYQAAVTLDPDDPALRNNLGVALARAGRAEEALVAFQEAGRKAKEQAATIYFNWGATLFNAERYAEAVERFRQATRSDKVDPMAFYFLGVSLYRARTTAPWSEEAPQQPAFLPGIREAFARYLELAPDGQYAAQAAEYLKQVGLRALP